MGTVLADWSNSQGECGIVLSSANCQVALMLSLLLITITSVSL